MSTESNDQNPTPSLSTLATSEIPGGDNPRHRMRSMDEVAGIAKRLMPDPEDRAWKLRLFADSLHLANKIAPRKWNLSATNDYIMLKIGHIAMNYLTPNGFGIVYDPKIYQPQNYDPTATTRRPGEPFKAVLRDQAWVYLLSCPTDDERRVILAAKRATMESADRSFDPSPAYLMKFHQPAVLEYLRKTVDASVPAFPFTVLPTPTEDNPPMNITTLQTQLQRQGLSFTAEQIATYITALQVKGFVILSGMSGTGKTKLAQGFAELLPKGRVDSTEDEDPPPGYVRVTCKPYMARSSTLTLPRAVTRLFDTFPKRKKYEVPVQVTHGNEQRTQVCQIIRSTAHDSTLILYLRGLIRNWFEQIPVGAEFYLGVNIDDSGVLQSVDITTSLEQVPGQIAGTATTSANNLLFIPVRPDWRDSKSLLGYYNPLTHSYVQTDFLRFVTAAAASHRRGEQSAWFVVLDEMNLARVEHYFADLLSVLESGRDEQGWTKEALRFGLQDDGDDELPEPLHLPPNLYIIGTVNMDETTHAFSPKVLDRAFTLEFNHVDFTTYGQQTTGEAAALSDTARQRLLLDFRGNGRQDPKTLIHAFLADNDWVRTELQKLNEELQPYNLHFGYRVFDEIVLFLVRAEQNELFTGIGGEHPAFDAAVLMKVLPKFHGSRARLEKPLDVILRWCQQPGKAQSPDSGAAQTTQDKLLYRYRRTAARVLRMLDQLRTDGFASFG